MATDTDLKGALEAILRREIPSFTSLLEASRLTAGASQETYKLRLATDGGGLPLALRRSPPTVASGEGVGGLSLDTEARLLQLARHSDIPVPSIRYVLRPEDGLGPGFIMDWLEGETLGQRINRAEQLAAIRPHLARQCGQILGRIHTLDWRAEHLQDQLPVVEPATLVAETFAVYQQLDVPVPMIDYTRTWLLANLPGTSRTTLVHGDFRNGNLMVSSEGITAVLDWELAHIGDPVRDLGWLCVNSWRFGQRELPVGGFGALADLLEGYRETSGITVSEVEVRFWEVFGSFWWSVITLQMANAWRLGETPSLERPVIGRRSSEAQMDCVNLLIPGPYTVPDFSRPITEGTQLPMPAELLEGVATFLKEEVAGQLTDHRGFLARVAANSLGIAQRELQAGSELASAELARLQLLLNSEEDDLDRLRQALVSRLREGMPLDTPGLADHLRQSVAGQLAVDQPRYSALQKN